MRDCSLKNKEFLSVEEVRAKIKSRFIHHHYDPGLSIVTTTLVYTLSLRPWFIHYHYDPGLYIITAILGAKVFKPRALFQFMLCMLTTFGEVDMDFPVDLIFTGILSNYRIVKYIFFYMKCDAGGMGI